MNNNRKEIAYAVRETAARLAHDRNHPRHISNGDEQKFRNYEEGSPPYAPSYLMSFTKGMPHNDKTGLVKEPVDFQSFVKGVDSGNPRDFKEIRLGRHNSCANTWRSTKAEGAEVRAWESQGAGLTFDLEGPDAHAVTMPPAPALGSLELTAEIAEVYAQALLRDVPFTKIADETGISPCLEDITVKTVLDNLGTLEWFKQGHDFSLDCHERSRKRMSTVINGKTAFRGITPGDDIGPYISQFLLAGNKGINKKDEEHTNSDGYITYGALNIDQRVRAAKCCSDHLTQWEEWLDVQEGANLSGMEEYDTQLCGKHTVKRRFITTGRDLATYVHYDALYEAYLNACLILMGLGVPYDPDIPYQTKDCMDHQQGFAHFGGPHILSLVTEVATRALKAVRFQKFNVHRRLRPEALAARLANHSMMPDLVSKELLKSMVNTAGLSDLLDLVEQKNEKNGKDLNPPPNTDYKNYLLPMAFCEVPPCIRLMVQGMQPLPVPVLQFSRPFSIISIL